MAAPKVEGGLRESENKDNIIPITAGAGAGAAAGAGAGRTAVHQHGTRDSASRQRLKHRTWEQPEPQPAGPTPRHTAVQLYHGMSMPLRSALSAKHSVELLRDSRLRYALVLAPLWCPRP